MVSPWSQPPAKKERDVPGVCGPRHTGASHGAWRGSWWEVVSRDTNLLETSLKGASSSRGFPHAQAG